MGGAIGSLLHTLLGRYPLQEALIDLDGTLDGTLEERVIALLKSNSEITQNELARSINVSVRSIKRVMKELLDNGKIVRIGGKRYGYWHLEDEK